MYQRLRAPIALLAVCLGTAFVVTAQEAEKALDPAAQQALAEARAAFGAKHYQDALKGFRKANKIEKDRCSVCWAGAAQAQKRLGDWNGALGSADKALATATDDQMRAVAHIIRGDIYLAMSDSGKNRKLAEGEYRIATQMLPANALFHLKLAGALCKQSLDDEGLQEAQRCLEQEPNGQFAAEAKRLIANPARARLDFAPDFQLTTLQGETFAVKDFAGTTLVLDFWATWCPPCRASVGELRDLLKKYPRESLVLVSVSADSDENKLREFLGEKKMDWPQYWDKQGTIRDLFDVHAFPTYLVIDGDGAIRARIVGLNPQDSVVHRLRQALPSIVSAKPQKQGQ